MKQIIDDICCVHWILNVEMKANIIDEVNIPPLIVLNGIIDESHLTIVKKRIKINVSKPVVNR